MAYDTARGVTVLFGGSGTAALGDTWEWNGTTWTQRMVSGPPAQSSHAMAYDAARGVTILFLGTSSGSLGETWEWNGTAWTQRLVNGPSRRYGHAIAYDAPRGVTVLFGGYDNVNYYGDTWEWNGTTWTQRMVSGPSARREHAMAYDVARGVTVLFGSDTQGETWGLRATCVAPSVISQPSAASACQVSPAAVFVAGAGTGPLSYQWQIQTVPGTWGTLGNDPLTLPCGGSAHASPFNGAATNIGITPCPGVNHYQVRCIVSNSCGSASSAAATVTVNSADFNGDGDSGTDADIEGFFACLAGSCCAACGSADFNGDGDTATDADIESFFRVLAGGPC
jgi:hypothetical protein